MKISELLKALEKSEIVFGDTDSDIVFGDVSGTGCNLGDYVVKETEICNLCHDSRKAVAGSMFFCLIGTKVDGAKFVAEAVNNGAVCLVTEKRIKFGGGGSAHTGNAIVQIIVPNVREAMSLIAKAFYGNTADEMRIVGVIGTNGKTTCTHILKHIFSVAGESVGVIGTLGTWFGDRLIEGGLTTPDPIDLHRTFVEMYDYGIRSVIMEASAHAIHFRKLAGIVFEAVIFTNISQDHLDFFGTFENYCNTKIGFFLSAGDAIKTAIINTDDEYGRRIMQERKGKSLGYSLREVQLFPESSVINNEFVVNLPARFNAQNAFGCLTTAKVLGVNEDHIKQALKTIPRISGRFNVFKVPVACKSEVDGDHGEITVIVDFAHTPDGLEKIISAVREFALGHVITVFGCGGNRDKEKRPIMGGVAAKLCDFTIITSDNPRFERPVAIMKQIRKGFRVAKNKKFRLIKDRTAAIDAALGMAKAGDIVIVAGKGGETHTEIKGKLIEYTDEFVITTHINKRSLKKGV